MDPAFGHTTAAALLLTQLTHLQDAPHSRVRGALLVHDLHHSEAAVRSNRLPEWSLLNGPTKLSQIMLVAAATHTHM